MNSDAEDKSSQVKTDQEKSVEIDQQPTSTSWAHSSPIFKKKGGTTDVGKDYEHLLIANIILKLVEDDNVEDFLLSSNDETFGSFDDVVVEVKYRNSENIVTYAVQLKHKNNGILTANQLAREKGDFSINEYFKNYLKENSLKKKSVKLILFTNCKFSKKTNLILSLDNSDVEVLDNQSNELISTTSEGCCFTFYSDEKNNGFLKKFFLYASQLKVEGLRKSCLDKFKTMFSCGETIFHEYLNFIVKWSLTTGNKEKLNKDWMRRMILVRVLSPFVQTLSFKGKPLNLKMEILHEAVSTFQITLLHQKDSYKQLKKNWENAIIDVDINQLNKTNKKYQVTTDYFQPIDESIKEDAEVKKILWLMKKCPLVIKANKPGVKEILDLLVRDEKIIILCPNFDVKSLKCLKEKQNAYFEYLSDLKGATEVYNKVLDNFVVSIEDQKKVTLREIFASAQVECHFNTDTLVKLENDPLLGCVNDDFALPKHYVLRTLSRIIIDSTYLKEFCENTLVIVTDVTEMRIFRQWCEENKISTIDFSTETQPNERTVYVTEDNCLQQQFDELCKKYKDSNCHQFKYINSDQLEWIRSKNGVDELRQYQLKDTQYIEESELSNCSDNNLINIICENPGMGKTTLMKSLKSATPSTCWTILIYARNYAHHFRENQDDIKKFLEYIVEDSCKCEAYSDLGKTILRKFLESDKIQIVWDGLDECLSNTLENVIKIIDKIYKKGLRQWLTSRAYLRNKLEQQFSVFSRKIKEFNKEEQMMYIKNRLDYSDEKMLTFLKINSNIDLMPNNSILGIPLQVFMLTELLIKNEEKYPDLLNNLYTIAVLYKYFVEKKIYDHYKEKRQYNFHIDENCKEFKDVTTNTINEYKIIAVQYYLEFDSDIQNKCQKLLLEIKKYKDPMGFIVKVTEDMSPQFTHNSYGEYFAALYLSEHYNEVTKISDFYLNDKYVNIRLFLDLILADTCKAHTAVLSLNSQLLDECTENDINLRDKVERTCLELSCEWFNRHPFFETFPLIDCYKIKTSNVDTKRLKKLRNLIENNFSLLLNKFEEATLPLKKNILLFPFLIFSNKQIDEIDIPSILYYAIKFNFKIVYLKDFPYTVISDNRTNKTLLHYAVEFRRIHFIKSFLSDPKYKDLVNKDLELWYKICALKSTDLLQVANYYGCDLNRKYNYLDSKVYTVAQYVDTKTNDSSTLNFLIENGADINLIGSSWNVLYSEASASLNTLKPQNSGFFAFAISVTDDNDDDNDYCNITSEPIVTCLTKLKYRYSTDTLKYLEKCGVYANVCDKNGSIPIHIACENESCGKDIVKYLVRCGSNVNKCNKNKTLPIHIACLNKMCGYSIVKCLVGCGSSVHDCDKNGYMPIHIACMNERRGKIIVEYLVKSGSFIHVCDKNDNMPIHIACGNEGCGDDIVKYLVGCGSNVNNYNKNGNMPIHIACKNEWCGTGVVKYLVEGGASVDKCDENGNMPIHIASENKRCGKDIVKYLVPV